MKKALFFLCISLFFACDSVKENPKVTYDFTTIFEKSEGTQTPTYPEVITYYKNLAESYTQIHLEEIGHTDAGEPLHLATYNPDEDFDFDQIRKEKTILLVNNGIHPGESDGIDATMMLFRDLANGTKKAPENVVIATIPVYNVGGSLNRNSGTRANQNGPEAYGFRGNAKNYDLNRDFIKSDTKNARAFAQIFHKVQPDVFVDSDVTGQTRLQYDTTKPFTKEVRYYNYFKPKKEVTVPKAYIIPKGWHNVIDLLQLNNVAIHTIPNDTLIAVETYHIKDFKTYSNPFEGHYTHYNTEVTKTSQNIGFAKGDVIVYTNQPAFRYLLETLEPEAVDSFFNWNFFDTILQQKEGFSAYVFEDEAKELLEKNPDWKVEFEEMKASDEKFAESASQQLRWIYKKSNHYEKAHLRYPIFKIAR